MATKSARPTMRDRVREEAQKSTTEGAGYLNLPRKVSFFNPKEGDFELDCIPYENTDPNHPKGYEKGELVPFFRFKIHSNIGAADEKVVCPTTFNHRCPICEERKAMAKKRDGDADVIKALNAKDRCLFQVIDLLDKKDESVQLWDASFHAFGKQLLKAIDTAENASSSRKRSLPHAGFAELEGGQTLLVTMEESANIKKFYQANRIDAADRDDYPESILDEVLELHTLLKVLSYEELEAKFLELDPAEQGVRRTTDDDKEEKPGRSARRGADEEEPPSRGRRGRTEDPLPEEPPARSRRGKAEPDPEPEKPAGRRGRATVEETPPEEKPAGRRGRAAVEPDPEEPPTRSRRGSAAKEESKSRCWVEGGVFGVDCDTHLGDEGTPNCYDCTIWEECNAAKPK